MIVTESLSKRFGDVTAVEDLSLKVDEGEVFGLLGPNGAGKTTTIRMLACLISKSTGSARVGGLDTSSATDSVAIRQMIGVLPENVGLYEELSAARNLDFYGELYGLTPARRAERIEGLLKMLDLWEKRDAPVSTFSKGMKQKIAVARAVIHEPKVLFLDEPTANLDPEAAHTIRELVVDLKEQGHTIILNTHRLEEADQLCDRVGILRRSLVAVGTPDELRSSLWETKTVIELERADPKAAAALEAAAGGAVEVDGNRLVVTVKDPPHENAALVAAVVGAGGKVVGVSVLHPSLEDVYLKLVRGKAP